MNPLVALPGLAMAGALLMFIYGYRLIRADVAEGLNLEELVILRPEQRRAARGEGPVGHLATGLALRMRRRLPARAGRWLQQQVDLAGRPDGTSVDTVMRSVMVWALMLSPAFVIFVASANLKGAALCLVAPPIVPLSRLARLRRLRREALDSDLPDFLDILAVTVTAGVAFRPALARVSARFGGPVAMEFQLALGQLENGASVRGAFEHLRSRSDSEALGQFVTAFLQSTELGAPLAESLNQIAVDMRRDHAQRMRRKAARLAPRVTLVTSIVLVPGTLILLLVGLLVGSGVDFGALLGGLR